MQIITCLDRVSEPEILSRHDILACENKTRFGIMIMIARDGKKELMKSFSTKSARNYLSICNIVDFPQRLWVEEHGPLGSDASPCFN
jgi:hypothetical protein